MVMNIIIDARSAITKDGYGVMAFGEFLSHISHGAFAAPQRFLVEAQAVPGFGRRGRNKGDINRRGRGFNLLGGGYFSRH